MKDFFKAPAAFLKWQKEQKKVTPELTPEERVIQSARQLLEDWKKAGGVLDRVENSPLQQVNIHIWKGDEIEVLTYFNNHRIRGPRHESDTEQPTTGKE